MILPVKEMPKGKEPKMSGEVLAGKKQTWEILDQYAFGGNGTIYTLKNNDDYLAKVFKFDDTRDVFVLNRKSRFIHEIEFLRQYSGTNKHMPLLMDESRNDDTPFFVMKKYHDINWLYQQKLSYEEKLEICLQLIEAIKFVHSTGTAHRDIKPKNLLFEENNGINLILTDYGLISNDDLDSPGDKLGSYGFTPPELRIRDENTDNYFPSDVYEFAKTVYALLSNKSYSFSDGISIIGQENEIRIKGNDLFLEPIYEMIEMAIKYDMKKRINIDKCGEYISSALKLSQTHFSTEWNDKRDYRRVVSLLIDKASYSVKDQSHISLFINKIVNGKYDIKVGETRLLIDKIVERKLPDDGPFYELVYNTNERMTILIEQLVISNSFGDEYDVFIRRVNSSYIVSAGIEKFKFIKKNQNERVNVFKL